MLALAATGGSAWAYGNHSGGRRADHTHRGSHHNHGAPRVGVGAYLWAPFWFYAPPFGYPPAVVSPPAPTVYIEQGDDAAPELPPGYWYYCAEAGAYYPGVEACPGPWQQVAPLAPPDR